MVRLSSDEMDCLTLRDQAQGNVYSSSPTEGHKPTRASSAGATRKMGKDPIHAESRQSWSTFAQESVDQLTVSQPCRGCPVLQTIWVRTKGQKLNSMPAVRWHR